MAMTTAGLLKSKGRRWNFRIHSALRNLLMSALVPQRMDKHLCMAGERCRTSSAVMPQRYPSFGTCALLAKNSRSAAICHSVFGAAFLMDLTPVRRLILTRATPLVAWSCGEAKPASGNISGLPLVSQQPPP
eukprot:CAMPEP_0178416734 /NCGR_PEP_ID=MMETSP0689_2-20121128/24215_1 /TAXON_ID=160604 /ORGANISM="Amphidinium massartii, Strain CS-259" /LENGTH=131 /DNA_ID=CAMNT_0020038085 /DNA_START=458 /DNA_END=853 /DNA_ORIENTATION=+